MGELFDYEQPQPYIVRGTEYDDSFPTPVLTAGQSFVLGYTNEKQGIKMASPEHPVIIFDDFTTSSHFVDFPFKVKSSAIKLLTLRDKNEDIHFAYQVLQNIAYTPVSHERHWISKFATFATLMPECKSEMQAIGHFMSNLDGLITLHQRKYDKLVIFKKSMLEKMFPKDGESVPEIRFAGFTDPWEQRKLGEIVSIGAGAPPSAFSAGNFLYVKVDDLNESSHFQFDSAQRVDANTAVKPIRKGSIIFAKRGAAILGNKVRVLGKTAYIDTNMMALEPRGVDADFLWLFINQTGLYRIADTSTIPQINNKHIEPYPVDIPNMAEQQAIGTFFSRLDDLITLHQRKLELLQDIKKSLLDKMFV